MAVQNVKELEVYRKAYALAMDIFELSKAFPAEERFALTSFNHEIGRILGSMLNNPQKWLIQPAP